MAFKGYKIKQRIDEGMFIIYKATREKDNVPVFLKAAEAANRKAWKQLENEFEIVSGLDPAFVVKPIAIEHEVNELAIVYAPFDGKGLDVILNEKPLSLERFLRIAIGISECILQIHKNGILHKDIKPANIIVQGKTDYVRITDFGISSLVTGMHIQTISNPNTIEGTLPYISPEQTGKMNRAVDQRSDLYSLGVTLYEMITCRLPFYAMDPVEWVYNHIAQMPVPPAKIISTIPKVLSDIIMKLLAKQPEDRYQTAEGLKYDLEVCLREYSEKDVIPDFETGQKDLSGKFRIIQKLYGREKESKILQDVYGLMTGSGAPQLVLISGHPGIGKTSLVNEFQNHLLTKAYFISGKFDQYKRDIPYFTIVEAFRELINNLLFSSEKEIKLWKEKIMKAVGSNGEVITEVIPRLELIIGKQEPVPEVSPMEAQARFNLVFENFINVFTTEEHPLIIFLDDLQWADTASFNLIQQIFTGAGNKYLMLVGAYRENEVDQSHPLKLMLNEIKNTGNLFNEIVLKALNREDINQLIKDSLRSGLQDMEPLAQLVFEKTAGNPFFIIQFLNTLHHENLLKFNRQKGKWEWSISDIKAKGYTDNIIDLMLSRIQHLNERSRRMIKLASCVGNKFDKYLLAMISSQPEKNVVQDLQEPMAEGLIIQEDESYRFMHDRVQQSAYAFLSEDEKMENHQVIGNLLYETTSQKDFDDNLFVICNHLNYSRSLFTDYKNKIKLAELNLLAGKKAKSSMAYDSARNYFSIGINILGDNAWEEEYDMCFKLHLALSECEYLLSNFGNAETLFEKTLAKAKTILEKVSVFNIRMVLYQTLGKFSEAAELGLKCLDMLELPFPQENLDDEIGKAFGKTQQLLSGREIQDLINLPAMTDPVQKAAMSIHLSLYAPFYNSKPHLLPLLTLRIVNSSLQYGNTPGSAYAYLFYGVTVGAVFGDYKSGYAFGKMALALNEKLKDKELSCKLNQIFGGLVNPWTQPLITSYAYQKKAYQDGLETGDLIYAGFAAGVYTAQRIIKGEDLQSIYEESLSYVDFYKRSKDEMMLSAFRLMQQHCKNLMGLTKEFASLSDDNYSEEDALTFMQQKQFMYSINWYYLVKMQVLYHSGAFSDALKAANNIKDSIAQAHFAQMTAAEFLFYRALSMTAVYNTLSKEEQESCQKDIKEIIEKYRQWSSFCPENFLHKYQILNCELSRINGASMESMMTLYKEAIASAKSAGYHQNEGLVCELAARYFEEKGFELISITYLREARECYLRWNAMGKVKHLELKYPYLRENKSISEKTTLGGIPVQHLDLQSIIKSSHAISGQLHLNQLIHSLLQIVMEQAGARKGALYLEKDGEINLAAIASVNSHISVETDKHFEKASTEFISDKIIQYVKRTKEKVISGNGSEKRLSFLANESKSKSIACIPIIKQTHLMGILYLENNLFAGVFTPEKLVVLDLLATQAAIALENAFILETLKKNENQLRMLVTQFPAIMWTTDTQLRFTSGQGLPLKKLEIPGEEVLGSTIYEYFNTEDKSFLPIASHIKALSGESVHYELGVAGFIWDSFVEPLRNQEGEIIGCIGLAMDITERKKMESELKESEERFRLLAESTNIIPWEADGKTFQFTYVGPQAKKALGYEIEEWYTLDFWPNHIHEEDRVQALEYCVQSYRTRKDYEFEYRMIAADGRILWFHDKVNVVTERGIPVLLRGFLIDITERKQIEERTKKLNIELEQRVNERTAELLAVNKDLESFSYLASHDLRSPLVVISSCCNLLMDEHITKMDEEGKLLIDTIINYVFKMSRLIDDLLAFSRLGKRELKKSMVDMSDLAEKALLEVHRAIPDHKEEVIINELPKIFADETLIIQVMVNLINNAIKYSSKKENPVIEIGSYSEDGSQVFFVKDNGAGFDMKKANKLFGVFERLHSKDEFDGTGLGLALVQRIISAHKGKAWAEAKVNEGATFYFSLPKH